MKTEQIKKCMNEKKHTNEKRSKWEKNYTIDEK